MKIKLLLLPCLLLFAGMLYAQVPQLINYQVIARNSNGDVMANTKVRFRFTIQDSITTGSAEYTEIDSGKTNQLGLFSVAIGSGTALVGSFNSIQWSTGKQCLLVEFAPADSTTYQNMGISQLFSVPYALYADSTSKNSYPVHYTGDYYGGGIIFWTDSLGQHGLIADTVDLDTGIVWNNGLYNLTNATRNGIAGGKANTERIVIRQGTGQYAAQLCADYQGGGYSDWYLPSVNELNLLYQQQAIVGGFVNGIYWSSNELSTQEATAISFSGGAFTPSNKTVTNAVRAIRTF